MREIETSIGIRVCNKMFRLVCTSMVLISIKLAKFNLLIGEKLQQTVRNWGEYLTMT